jgi:hypothetical protein
MCTCSMRHATLLTMMAPDFSRSQQRKTLSWRCPEAGMQCERMCQRQHSRHCRIMQQLGTHVSEPKRVKRSTHGTATIGGKYDDWCVGVGRRQKTHVALHKHLVRRRLIVHMRWPETLPHIGIPCNKPELCVRSSRQLPQTLTAVQQAGCLLKALRWSILLQAQSLR